MKIIQIEVSTVCNGACIYCPLTIFSATWNRKFMDISLFIKILNEGKELGFEHVHLQGWGEPLLHPRFIELLSMAKTSFMTSFATNGVYLTNEMAHRILKAGVDLVAVTFAGATAATHNMIRKGNDFDTVVQNVKNFIKISKLHHNRPKVVAIYMLLKETLRELPRFVELAANLGVDEINLSNISYIPNLNTWRRRIFTEFFREVPHEVLETIKEARRIAEEFGIPLNYRRFSPLEYTICPENPLSTLFINVEGDVSPCVYLNIPAHDPVRCFEGRCEKAPRLVFGNLKTENLKTILTKRRYKDFINIWEMRVRETTTPVFPPDDCKNCYLLYGI
ncbi:MAG: radical SAM/SPASM domain-containing protein [Pyrobaculum sp.]|uniref:radical SAM protein n=1 Tax=Pyrobaculum sp. TaxID=2004705 RepID=UPI003CB12371